MNIVGMEEIGATGDKLATRLRTYLGVCHTCSTLFVQVPKAKGPYSGCLCFLSCSCGLQTHFVSLQRVKLLTGKRYKHCVGVRYTPPGDSQSGYDTTSTKMTKTQEPHVILIGLTSIVLLHLAKHVLANWFVDLYCREAAL